MDADDVLRLSMSCMHVLQNDVCDSTFEGDLIRFADVLLSRSSPNEPSLRPDENFQALIMYMAKLVVTSVHCIPPPIFLQLFRAITAFGLAFYNASQPHFTRFVSEWSPHFAANYVRSVLDRFLAGYRPTAAKTDPVNQMVAYASETILVFIYFSDDPTGNPFLKMIEALPEEKFANLLEAVKLAIQTPFSAITLYTAMVFRQKFKGYCVSCVDAQWILDLARQISKTNPAAARLRLNILLMMSEDSGFVGALSSGICLPVLSHLFGFLRESIAEEGLQQDVFTTISILLNIAQKLNGFDIGLSQSLFLLMRLFLKLSNSANRFAEYLRLLTHFAESLAIDHGKGNLPIVYEILRNASLFEKLNGVVAASENPEDFRRSLENLRILVQVLTQTVLQKEHPSADYDQVMRDLRVAVDAWAPASLFDIRPTPVFEYLCHEFRHSVLFFRLMILKDIQELFCGAPT
jgi:hypothetical protein